MSWCSHHPTFTSVMVYSTELRRRVVQSVGVTAAVSACCMMHLGDVEVTESALSALCALRCLLSALWVRCLLSALWMRCLLSALWVRCLLSALWCSCTFFRNNHS